MRQRINRRLFVGLGSLGAISIPVAVLAQSVEIEPAPLPTGTPAATPQVEGPMYEGDIEDLWRQPWEIGSDLVTVGATIIQRFIGSDTQGFALGIDGLTFQSVIYAKYGFQMNFFIGINNDLSELEEARTLLVTGTYGGVQLNTDSRWEDPIVIAHTIEVPE